MYFIYIHILVGFDAIDNAKNKFEEQPVGKKNRYKSNAKKKKKRTIVVIQIHIKFYF